MPCITSAMGCLARLAMLDPEFELRQAAAFALAREVLEASEGDGSLERAGRGQRFGPVASDRRTGGRARVNGAGESVDDNDEGTNR
jgi:hypothetical protein